MTLHMVYLHIYPTKIFSLEIKMNITVIISSINADNKVTFSCRTHTFVHLPELFSSLQTRLLKLIIYFFQSTPNLRHSFLLQPHILLYLSKLIRHNLTCNISSSPVQVFDLIYVIQIYNSFLL